MYLSNVCFFWIVPRGPLNIKKKWIFPVRILNTYEFCINYDYQDCHSKIMIIAYANPDGLWDKVQTDDFFKMVTMWILFSSMYQAINLMTSFTWRRCFIRPSSEMLVSKNEVPCLLKTFPWELNIGYYEAHSLYIYKWISRSIFKALQFSGNWTEVGNFSKHVLLITWLPRKTWHLI